MLARLLIQCWPSRRSNSPSTSEPTRSRVQRGGTLRGTCRSVHAHLCQMVSYNEPSNWLHWKSLRRILDALMKWRYGIYEMKLIYVQARVNGQGNPEFALEIRKKERKKDWQFVIFLTSGSEIVFMIILGLDRKFAGDYEWLRNLSGLPALRFLVLFNVLHICTKLVRRAKPFLVLPRVVQAPGRV